MSQVITYAPRRSLAACCIPPPKPKDTRSAKTREIQERFLKHIEEITKDLGPPQSEDLNYEQEEWQKFRMARPFPKPYRSFPPMVIPYRWEEQETDQ